MFDDVIDVECVDKFDRRPFLPTPNGRVILSQIRRDLYKMTCPRVTTNSCPHDEPIDDYEAANNRMAYEYESGLALCVAGKPIFEAAQDNSESLQADTTKRVIYMTEVGKRPSAEAESVRESAAKDPTVEYWSLDPNVEDMDCGDRIRITTDIPNNESIVGRVTSHGSKRTVINVNDGADYLLDTTGESRTLRAYSGPPRLDVPARVIKIAKLSPYAADSVEDDHAEVTGSQRQLDSF
ncbi:hypothetical protein [Salinibaculum rarum]|uniref:hypothetical protein n=1 Tax=Salinibaculum rarum TaxID=3058903 RepID=UPI00265FF42D|nr:hypothetical protein [Salinibaculum sp. KK48]